jgi:hypothetical protein
MKNIRIIPKAFMETINDFNNGIAFEMSVENDEDDSFKRNNYGE